MARIRRRLRLPDACGLQAEDRTPILDYLSLWQGVACPLRCRVPPTDSKLGRDACQPVEKSLRISNAFFCSSVVLFVSQVISGCAEALRLPDFGPQELRLVLPRWQMGARRPQASHRGGTRRPPFRSASSPRWGRRLAHLDGEGRLDRPPNWMRELPMGNHVYKPQPKSPDEMDACHTIVQLSV